MRAGEAGTREAPRALDEFDDALEAGFGGDVLSGAVLGERQVHQCHLQFLGVRRTFTLGQLDDFPRLLRCRGKVAGLEEPFELLVGCGEHVRGGRRWRLRVGGRGDVRIRRSLAPRGAGGGQQGHGGDTDECTCRQGGHVAQQ